jgi:hypothetical protein
LKNLDIILNKFPNCSLRLRFILSLHYNNFKEKEILTSLERSDIIRTCHKEEIKVPKFKVS